MLRYAGAGRHVLEPLVYHPCAHIGRRLADNADRPDLADQEFPDFLRDLNAFLFGLADGAAQQLETFQQFRIGRLDAGGKSPGGRRMMTKVRTEIAAQVTIASARRRAR